MRRFVLTLALLVATPVTAAPSDDLRAVIDQHWAWYLRNNPVQATTLGVRTYDSAISDLSLAQADREAGEAGAFLQRLRAIPDAGLTPAERVNKAILSRMLSEQVEGNRFGARAVLFNTYSGWHQNFAGMAEGLPFRTRADYESYLTRLAKYPDQNRAAIEVTRGAVAKGYAQPCVVLGGFEKTIEGVISANPAKSRFYAPFAGARPPDMDAAAWEAMRARARTVITGVVEPEYRRLLQFYRADYKPKCREAVGASALSDGRAWYAYRARVMTTTTQTPDQIHALGLREVARIRAEMEAVAKRAGYASREAFVAKLRTDLKYYATTPEQLLSAAAATAKAIDGKMPGLFGRLPRLPYGIRAIPAETAEGTTTAYYSQGSPESGLSGTYYVNTSKLPQRPLWELPALTLHEAVPGHHHQIALQQELELPEFRKHAAFFTAFVEGWGLYAERLGIEMGLYDTPEKDMGRLSYEMWRASRLVVDTGLHSQGWTKARAVAFMTDNTALSAANINAEVNRYISWPGQALAYKIGELKIRELRERAEKALAAKFDLRRFHDAVLGQGAVPLDVLERQVDGWVAGERGRS
ncbi:MAG: protein of unknown function DUF885 [uncultured Sphingomonadaceae bacterium]|uniref:DUF885 domain-containing protein n=1 Tax=uncultured Sphingomonadaceae bacterium TaxID=169976 RepID=A0A6J4SQN4_9SPHN|nr:MAG: protein of unknown function DUF885 [uncultured Sphingomonadaceae bacterium]